VPRALPVLACQVSDGGNAIVAVDFHNHMRIAALQLMKLIILSPVS
jgi:hypothetical protein